MKSLDRLLIGGACIVILVAGMRAASSIIAFVLFAGLLAMCISPLVEPLTMLIRRLLMEIAEDERQALAYTSSGGSGEADVAPSAPRSQGNQVIGGEPR